MLKINTKNGLFALSLFVLMGAADTCGVRQERLSMTDLEQQESAIPSEQKPHEQTQQKQPPPPNPWFPLNSNDVCGLVSNENLYETESDANEPTSSQVLDTPHFPQNTTIAFPLFSFENQCHPSEKYAICLPKPFVPSDTSSTPPQPHSSPLPQSLVSRSAEWLERDSEAIAQGLQAAAWYYPLNWLWDLASSGLRKSNMMSGSNDGGPGFQPPSLTADGRLGGQPPRLTPNNSEFGPGPVSAAAPLGTGARLLFLPPTTTVAASAAPSANEHEIWYALRAVIERSRELVNVEEDTEQTQLVSLDNLGSDITTEAFEQLVQEIAYYVGSDPLFLNDSQLTGRIAGLYQLLLLSDRRQPRVGPTFNAAAAQQAILRHYSTCLPDFAEHLTQFEHDNLTRNLAIDLSSFDGMDDLVDALDNLVDGVGSLVSSDDLPLTESSDLNSVVRRLQNLLVVTAAFAWVNAASDESTTGEILAAYKDLENELERRQFNARWAFVDRNFKSINIAAAVVSLVVFYVALSW